jgi:hypothetical protein
MRFNFSLFIMLACLSVSAQEHPGFRILSRDNHYGAVNDFDEVVIPFEFQRLEILYTGMATQVPKGVHPRNIRLLASRDGKKFGILDGAGKVVFPYRFTKMAQLHYFYPAERSTYGNLITPPPPYDEVLRQTALIFRFDSAGVVNGNGEQILPFEYRDVKPVYGSPHPGWVSVHTRDGRVGIFDLHGHWLIEPRFADVPEVFRNIQLEDMPMYPTLLVANEEKEGWYKYGLIDSVGHAVIPFEYDGFGLAFKWKGQWHIWAKKGGKWGMIDYQNREVIPFEYGRPNRRYLIDGQLYWSVMSPDAELYGLISEKNEVLLPFKYHSLNPGNDRLLLFSNGNKKAGLVDLEGREVLPAAYDAIAYLRYGYFSLHDYENQVRGVADPDGKIVVEPAPYNGIYPEDMLQRFGGLFQAKGIKEEEVVTMLTQDEGTWALLRSGELVKVE